MCVLEVVSKIDILNLSLVRRNIKEAVVYMHL